MFLLVYTCNSFSFFGQMKIVWHFHDAKTKPHTLLAGMILGWALLSSQIAQIYLTIKLLTQKCPKSRVNQCMYEYWLDFSTCLEFDRFSYQISSICFHLVKSFLWCIFERVVNKTLHYSWLFNMKKWFLTGTIFLAEPYYYL